MSLIRNGTIAAVMSARALPGPSRYLAVLLGCITLLALFSLGVLIPVLGDGGAERWIAYPVIFWLTGLGGYFLGEAVFFPRGMKEKSAW